MKGCFAACMSHVLAAGLPFRNNHVIQCRLREMVFKARGWEGMKLLMMAAGAIALMSGMTRLAQSDDLKKIAIVCHCRADFPTYLGFETGLTELAYRDGNNVRLIRKFSDGDVGRLARNVKEAVAANPNVIFAGFTPAVVAIQKETTTIPVVFAGVSDASEIGAATRFNRPEHNFTGPITINRELMPKRLELLKAAFPKLSKFGYLANPQYALHNPQLHEMEEAARRLGVELNTVLVHSSDDLIDAFRQLTAQNVQAVVVQQDPLFTGQSVRIVALAEASRLPVIYALRTFYDAGGLMWYGADIVAQFRRAADYVDRILKGTSPTELPIERPAKLQLTINLKLAKRIAAELSPEILARADEVIE
jgi:putative ABC transport system substrate-binding protein